MHSDSTKKMESDILAMYDSITEYLEADPDPTEVGQLFLDIEDLKKQFAAAAKCVTDHLIAKMGKKSEMTINGRTIEKKQKSDRKEWDHKGLTDIVLHRVKMMSMNDDGELELTPDEAVAKLLTFAHIDYWRIGELSTLDINADRFCKVTEGEDTIISRKSK